MFRLMMVLIFVTTPLLGDWLVTTEGSNVETEGAWTVKGRQVVFTLPGGTLSSLRLSEVDLDKSASLTAEARKPKVKVAPPPPRKSVLKLTDADVGHVDPSSIPNPFEEVIEADGEIADENGEESSPAADRSSRIVVENWAQEESTARGGWTVTGTLRNTSEGELRGISLSVHALDGTGEVMGQVQADVASTVLAQGGTTIFSAFFSGIEEADDFNFNPLARLVKVKTPVPAVDDDSETEADDSFPTEGFEEEDLEE